MSPVLDVVLVNWNAGELLRACLASFADVRREGFELGRVIVVDNASSDGSAEGLEAVGAAAGVRVEVRRNGRNLGFGRACNAGARGSVADHLLFLNPDTRLLPDSLAVPVAHLAAEPRVAIAGIQLVDEAGEVTTSCARFPTLPNLLASAVGVDRLLPRAGLGVRMTEWDHAESRRVHHVMGAFLMIRREVFEAVGGFDEDYFVYFEDLDLSRRVAAAGWESSFLAEARALHVGQGTTRNIRARRLALWLLGKRRYARKHLAGWRAPLVHVLTLVVEPLFRCAGSLARRSPAELRATLGATRMLWRASAEGVEE